MFFSWIKMIFNKVFQAVNMVLLYQPQKLYSLRIKMIFNKHFQAANMVLDKYQKLNSFWIKLNFKNLFSGYEQGLLYQHLSEWRSFLPIILSLQSYFLLYDHQNLNFSEWCFLSAIYFQAVNMVLYWYQKLESFNQQPYAAPCASSTSLMGRGGEGVVV